jgi:hypothetical protein
MLRIQLQNIQVNSAHAVGVQERGTHDRDRNHDRDRDSEARAHAEAASKRLEEVEKAHTLQLQALAAEMRAQQQQYEARSVPPPLPIASPNMPITSPNMPIASPNMPIASPNTANRSQLRRGQPHVQPAHVAEIDSIPTEATNASNTQIHAISFTSIVGVPQTMCDLLWVCRKRCAIHSVKKLRQ